MPEDRTTLTADASQYFDVLSRAGVAADRLGASGARVGQGFVRGERVIRTASANIAASLLTSGDAATTALVAMQGLERVFKIGILPTVAVAGGIAIFEKFHEQIQKTKDLYKDFYDELKKPIGKESGPSEFIKEIDTINEKLTKLERDKGSVLNKLMRLLGRGAAAFAQSEGVLFRRPPDFITDPDKKINEARKAAEERVADLTDKEGQRLANAIARLADKINNTIENTLKGPRDLLADIGSGQFMKDFAQQKQRDANVKRGQEIAAEIADAIAKGIPLGEVLQAEAKALGLVGGAKGFSIEDLATLDFTNMNKLSKYDFTGLSPLSGLQILIQ